MGKFTIEEGITLAVQSFTNYTAAAEDEKITTNELLNLAHKFAQGVIDAFEAGENVVIDLKKD